MLIKTIVIVAFILIIVSLGSALLHLVKYKGGGDSKKMLKALTVRISLSIALFFFVYIMIATGLYTPHGIGARMYAIKAANNSSEEESPNQLKSTR